MPRKKGEKDPRPDIRRVLALAAEATVTANMIATALGIDCKAASKKLYKLESRGLLARQTDEDGGLVSSARLSYAITGDGRNALAKDGLARRCQADFGPITAALGLPCAEVLEKYRDAQPRVSHSLNWES